MKHWLSTRCCGSLSEMLVTGEATEEELSDANAANGNSVNEEWFSYLECR